MMDQPIIHPSNPYLGVVRVFPGTMIRINGMPRPNATEFNINLQTGPSINPRDDLALHLRPCFTPPRIYRNSLIQGSWGAGETWGNGSSINPHQPFEILILNENTEFKIAVNGAHFCEFKHRIPFQQITHLTIDGDVDIHKIHITSPAYQTASAPQPPLAHTQPNCPYPINPPMSMPMPSLYPSLPGTGSNYPPAPVPGYSQPSAIPGVPGPMPTPAYTQQPYPPPYGGSQIPGQPGPAPMPANQMGGYPVSIRS